MRRGISAAHRILAEFKPEALFFTGGYVAVPMALAGRRIEGHVVAERAGHAMHTALVSRLLKDRSAWELAHVPVAAGPEPETLEAVAPGGAFGSPALAGVADRTGWCPINPNTFESTQQTNIHVIGDAAMDAVVDGLRRTADVVGRDRVRALAS